MRLLKYGDSLYRCKQLKRAALVRTSLCLKSVCAVCIDSTARPWMSAQISSVMQEWQWGFACPSVLVWSMCWEQVQLAA